MIHLKWCPLALALLLLPLSPWLRAAESEPPLEALLAGEFAGQEGDYDRAARHFLEAARASEDPAIASRAAQTALLASDPELARQALARWRELDPDSTELLAAEATDALRRGRLDEAERSLTALIARPGDGWRLALRALLSSDDAEATAEVLQRLLAARALPDDLSAWLAFGGLAQRLGVAEPAEVWLAALIERFPDQPRVWLLQAGQLRERGETEAARAAITRALAADRLDEPLRLAAAAELEQLGDPAAAAAALAEGPQSIALYAARAGVLSRAEDRDGLDRLFAEVREASGESPDPAHRLLLGQLSEVLERDAEALEWYRGVVGSDAEAQARLRVAMILAETGRLDEALAELRGLQNGDVEDDDLLRNAFLLEAELLLRADRPREALVTYERGLEAFEQDPELLYARALVHERLDDIAAAEADLRRLLELDPDNANVLNALGYTLADRTDRYQEALGYIERALEALPDNPAVIDSMGWVLYRLGRLEEALAYLRRAFELQADAEIAAHLGEVLWFSDRRDEARAAWRRGLEVDPGHRVLRRTLERLGPELLP